jgi:hypothetical protein
MDINEAALRLKDMEIVKSQIDHLQSEARLSTEIEYSNSCHNKAQELLMIFFKREEPKIPIPDQPEPDRRTERQPA